MARRIVWRTPAVPATASRDSGPRVWTPARTKLLAEVPWLRPLCDRSTGVPDLGSEQSRSFYPFMGGESCGCDQLKPIPREVCVTSDEVVRANFAFGPCQQEAIRGHDDLRDRGLAEASRHSVLAFFWRPVRPAPRPSLVPERNPDAATR